MNRIIRLMGVWSVFAAIFFGGSVWADQDVIKVGLLAPITGPTPDWGKKQVIGMEMSLEEINKRGGIYGKPVEVVVYDSGGDADRALALYRKLVEQDKVVVVIGPLYSGPCQVLIPQTNEGKVAIIATASAKPGLSDLKKWPYGFRMTVSSEKKEVFLAKTWVEAYQIKSIVIVYDAKAAVTATLGAKLWPRIFGTLNVTVLNKDTPITFETGQKDYSDVAKQIAEFKPGGICISALPQEAGHLVAEIRRAGLNQPLLGSSPTASPMLIDIANDAAEGLWAVSLFNKDDPSPRVQAYVKKFQKRCKERYPDMDCEPEQFDVAVYDILSFVVDIMKKKGIGREPEKLQEDRKKMRDGLATMKRWRGTAGMMAFDKKGDGIRTIHILHVKNGKWQPVR